VPEKKFREKIHCEILENSSVGKNIKSGKTTY
jgi:hypothetical protein